MRALAAALCLSTGCSFALVGKPPKEPTPRCDSSRAAPAGDIALGTLWLMPAVFSLAFGLDDPTCDDGDDCGQDPEVLTIGVIFSALVIAHYSAAVVGFNRTGECRARKRDFYRLYYAPPPPPPAYGPPSTVPGR